MVEFEVWTWHPAHVAAAGSRELIKGLLKCHIGQSRILHWAGNRNSTGHVLDMLKGAAQSGERVAYEVCSSFAWHTCID
jgi:hypothetical protein